MKGVPSGLYILTDHEYRTSESAESSKHMKSNSSAAQWALIQITGMDHHNLKPYNESSQNRLVGLKGLAASKVEIVQTGMTGNWCDGDIPVGLYPGG